MLDPSAFMGNSNNAFDPSQFQNQQMPPQMPNGGMRNPSPSFQNPAYQTNPVIPSKRPRPREDSMASATSPRQGPGNMGANPGSRSQTPSQSGYPGYPPNNQPPQQPNQFSHLQQNGSANASPSPVMSNQLRPGGVPQRVSTASPHPFSPAAQQFAPQASPSQSDHGSRTDTPQGQFMPNSNMQNANFQPPFNQAFTPPPNRGSMPPQGGMPTPQMQQPPQMYQQGGPQQGRPPQNMDQKMMYQMRLQQQMQQNNLMSAQRGQNGPPGQNPMQRPQMPNGQYPQGQRPPNAGGRQKDPRQFMEHLTAFMQSRNLPLETNLQVADRTINVVMLYMAVTKFGGHKKVDAMNAWPQISNALTINPMQFQTAPAQLKAHYERNLSAFEDAYTQQQARQRAQMMQSQGAVAPSGQMSPTKGPSMGASMQNPQYMNEPQHSQMMQPHMPPQTPVKQMSQGPGMNGFTTPQMQLQSSIQSQARNSMPRSLDPAAQNGFQTPMQDPMAKGGLGLPAAQVAVVPAVPQPYEMPKEYTPMSRLMDSYGGIGGLDPSPDSLSMLTIDIMNLKPNVPQFPELGLVDIHALTMSLQSGINSEVRLALDTLATLSVEPRLQLDLKSCEDLVESIIDCAEEQVDFLAENAAEVSDVMLINSYEDVVRGCRIERDSLQDCPEFGSLDYELDRSVERLICITTIIRNFSFIEANQPPLADELVIKFLCTVIRYLGTRNMLLRTNANTLDFMKDIIIFLSNLAQAIEIPGKEQALCLLHFLLAFAPTPPPCSAGSDSVVFSPYDPAVHRYLPPAVDSLAKLLARDEPNRTLYKSIFASDTTSLPPYELLTKAFGLAISPIPNHRREEQRFNIMAVVEARKPHLMQGMLAAEILSNLVPGYETNLAKMWLTSDDGFAQSLLHLITVLSSAPSPPVPQRGAPPPGRGAEEEALLHITLSGINVLRRLSEKVQSPADMHSQVPIDGMIKQENLLGALLLKPPAQPKAEVIKQLVAYAATAR